MDMVVMRFLTDNYVDMKAIYMELKNAVKKTTECGANEECLNALFKTLVVWIPKAEKFFMETMKARVETYYKTEEPWKINFKYPDNCFAPQSCPYIDDLYKPDGDMTEVGDMPSLSNEGDMDLQSH